MYQSDEEQWLVELQLDVLLRRHGNAINVEEHGELRDHLVAFYRRAEGVRKIPLPLGQQPALRFYHNDAVNEDSE